MMGGKKSSLPVRQWPVLASQRPGRHGPVKAGPDGLLTGFHRAFFSPIHFYPVVEPEVHDLQS